MVSMIGSLASLSGTTAPLFAATAPARSISNPLAPTVIVAVFAAMVMLVLAAHALSLRHAEMTPSRRRIRLANAVVMMFATPIIAFAFAFAKPSEPRVFTVSWMLACGLLLIVLLLATADVMNTWRLLLRERRRLRSELTTAAVAAQQLARTREPSLRIAEPGATT